jgi:uncharacterized membrane protein
MVPGFSSIYRHRLSGAITLQTPAKPGRSSHNSNPKACMNQNEVHYKPLIIAGIFLGIGMGGFFDGILFHQILQLHSTVSAKIPRTSITNLETNIFWDGMFHLFNWIITAIGLTLLWRAGRRADVPWSGRTFVGSLFLGWGLFNLVEGSVNNHILQLHHVVERFGESTYDIAYLFSGVLFLIIGFICIRTERHRELVFHPLSTSSHRPA